MSSPQRLFRNLTTAQIQQLIDSGFDRALNGDLTSGSGGGKSHTKKPMDLETLLMEANYELGLRDGSNPPNKVYSDFTGQRPYNGITVT